MAKTPSTERVRRYRQTHKLKQIEVHELLHETLKKQAKMLDLTIPALLQRYSDMFHESLDDTKSWFRVRSMMQRQ